MEDDSTIQAQVEGLNEYGEGWFRHGKHIIKLARTVPGDLVLAKVPTLTKRYVRAEVLELREASAWRMPNPACPHFRDPGKPFEPLCGGCQLLHVAYPQQLLAKAKIVGDFLGKAKIDHRVLPTLGMATPEAYRNKMSLFNLGGRLGFKKEYSEEAVFPRFCQQETPENQAIWLLIHGMEIPKEILQLHLRSVTGRVGILLFVKHYNAAVMEFAEKIMALHPSIVGVGAASYRDYRVLVGKDDLVQELGAYRYQIPLNGFFQTNYSQALVLRDLALQQLSLNGESKVLELYCGSGFFSLPVASKSKKLIGIENNRDSIRTAIANCKANRISNAHFESADVAKQIKNYQRGDFHSILLDPPREGCQAEVLSEILRLQPERIVYVSCSPETLARDLSTLASKGYALIYCQPVDMFPHTFHVEVVATLIKNHT